MSQSDAQQKNADVQRVYALPVLQNNPLNNKVEELAKTLFEQTHLVWTQEEVNKHWADPEYQAEINQYRYLAKVSVDFLFPRIKNM